MKTAPKYPKILTLGQGRTENALLGEVLIQEKVDGSLFRFGINEDRELVMGSKSVDYTDYVSDNGFSAATNYILSIKDHFASYPEDTYIYGEYLRSPKHNVLGYSKVPKNNIVIFDCISNGRWLTYNELEDLADLLGVDIVPLLYQGQATKTLVQDIANTQSYLGSEISEGVVIKNYNQLMTSVDGAEYPLFTKYVRQEFRERKSVSDTTSTPKWNLEVITESYRAEPRWQKAKQYLQDRGELKNEPQDIPNLVKRVCADIEEEEKEGIKNELYKLFIRDILKGSTKGLPEWYKNSLINN